MLDALSTPESSTPAELSRALWKRAAGRAGARREPVGSMVTEGRVVVTVVIANLLVVSGLRTPSGLGATALSRLAFRCCVTRCRLDTLGARFLYVSPGAHLWLRPVKSRKSRTVRIARPGPMDCSPRGTWRGRARARSAPSASTKKPA